MRKKWTTAKPRILAWLLLAAWTTVHAAEPSASTPPLSKPRVVHVFVALCDNKHQGIAPVPAALGNGQDPNSNLYWGALYGVKTFFKRAPQWKELKTDNSVLPANVLQRAVFELKESSPRVVVVADAYDGRYMKQTLTDFFAALGGTLSVSAIANGESFAAGKDAALMCFVGHNGLMDGDLPLPPAGEKRANLAQYIALCCKSDAYFRPKLSAIGCTPALTTAQFMAPEGYVLDAAMRAWAKRSSSAEIRQAAGEAYAKYQKLSPTAGSKVFVAGKD